MEMKFVFGIWLEEYVMSIEEDGLTRSDLEYGDEIEVMEDWMVWLRNCEIGDAREFMKMMERMHEDAFMKVVEMVYLTLFYEHGTTSAVISAVPFSEGVET
jgi:hypothetical protein